MKIRITKDHIIQIKYDNMTRYTNLLHGYIMNKNEKKYILYYKDKDNKNIEITNPLDLKQIMEFINGVEIWIKKNY